jgi:VanZ family protein
MLLTLFAMLAAFAAADEVTQPLFGRAAEATDWVADVAGIAVALAVWAGCRQVTRRLRMPAG